MADQAGEKTEAPTPRRRKEARDKGRVAKSQDLSAAVVILAGLIALQIWGPGLWRKLMAAMQSSLSISEFLTAADLAPTAGGMARLAMWAMVPLLIAVFVGALAALYWQVGILWTWRPVTPSLDRLNPLQGFKRIFSPRTAVATAINFAKMIFLVAVVYWTLAGGFIRILHSMNMDHVELYVMAAAMLLKLGIRLAIVMLIIALIDYAYQRYRHEQDLKMSKQEVREELKNMEGDPHIKRRRRDVQMRLARQRVQRDVPRADVVVTNPTHFAIALRYRPEEMNAPRVVAKGADWMAYQIRQVAAAHGIPIVERRELVRMMYDAVEVGQEIPERFYQAIAEILAYVYELSGKRLGPQAVPLAT